MSDEEAPSCPQCGADMVRRRNSSTRTSFWGCTKYPACKGTTPAEDDEEEQLPSQRYSERRRWERE